MSEPLPPPPGAYPGPPGGYPPPLYGGYPAFPPAGPRNGLGTAALVVAIVGLLTCWTVLGGVVLGITAIVLGGLGRGRAKRGEATNGGVATAGIALGALSIIAGLAFVAIYATLGWSMFKEVGGGDYIDCVNRAGSDQAAIEQCANEFTERVEQEFSVTVTPTR
jgi:uncharacterized protein DUF4190